ncbi:tripartite tricarboxylate transporter substrate binding protein [Roseomonas terrae]|jgi:tripartite-type tricarboxylate transporter receptor subunit TctC|uniref:Tripartite tricarboxylate transporter substrate binding protein n=1 Tax=Neoroseomonas terrae TaxID=424799 RepID=A0ABS5EB74_9PROT|nr:tripartite tricarboxylate transporter substrate-binding protein [Neoroseomonas terrae]MBR0648270.1 tripartite tricarboxylate transporter substrate binding protein [Neoroseomonas terrae]
MTSRRALIAASIALPAVPRSVAAQEGWPSRAVAVLLGYPPGGVTDFAARAVTERMGRALGQTLVLENRPGAATAVANTAAAQARPDGYTLLMGTSTLAINPALQPTLTPRDPQTALTPIGTVFRTAFVLHVHPSLPVRSTAELIAYAKANPGKLNFGSSGTGAVNHLCLELFRARAGIDVVHVPYRGGPAALLDLRENRIQGMFNAVQEALPAVQAGATRGIAISSKDRAAAVPDLPPIADVLPGFDGVFWQGLFGPAGLPAPIVARAGAALREATTDPDLTTRMAAQGVALVSGDAEALRRMLAEETEMWGRLIREQNIRAE